MSFIPSTSTLQSTARHARSARRVLQGVRSVNTQAGPSTLPLALARKAGAGGRRASGSGSRLKWVAGAAAGGLVATYECRRTNTSLALESEIESATKSTQSGAIVAQDDAAPQEYLSLQEVAKHNLSQDSWVIVNGKVYETQFFNTGGSPKKEWNHVTHFHEYHPGGATVILANAGTDVSALFNPLHPPGTIENNLPPDSFKGYVDPAVTAKANAARDAERERVERARGALPPVESILGLDEFQEAANTVMSPKNREYYAGGALDSISRDDNLLSFRKCRIVPRVLRDVSQVRPQTTIFGVESALPVYIAPASNALLGHPEGELNLTRGACKTGIVQGVSYVASYPLTDILDQKEAVEEEVGEKMGMVYQVYVRADREKTKGLVQQAIDAGCQALLFTVDSNVGDFRQSVEKMKGTTGSAEPGRKMGPFTDHSHSPHDASLNWKDVEWLKGIAGDVPVYLKGVSSVEDLRLARDAGVKGCILSNHGGRQLDRARAGFDSLRRIREQDPAILKQLEIYVDGGARRGTDVLMALALGAKGVGMGRPFLYAQAAYGEKGAIRAVRILEREIVTAMQLMGVSKLDQLRPEMVECLKEFWV